MAEANAKIIEFLQEALDTEQNEEIIEFCEMEFEQSPQLKSDPTVLRILALAHFFSKNYEESTTHFKALSAISNDPDNWLSLTTSCIMAGNVDEALAAFDGAIAMHKKHGTREHMTPGMMTFYVMCAFRDTEEYDHAYAQLDKLGEVYKELNITDPHFLMVRGMPDFSNLLQEAVGILENQPSQITQLWLKSLYESVDHEGKTAIKRMHAQLFDK